MTPGEAQLVKLETLLDQLTKDMKAARHAAEQGLQQMDKRVSMVELGVRGLEDREVRRRTLEEERARVAELQEEKHQRELKQTLSTKQFIAGTAALVVLAPLLSAIAQHFFG